MLEVPLDLLDVARHARVAPDERVEARDRLDDLAHVLVVGIEDDTVRDLVLAHQRLDAVPVERDTEHRVERPDVHVRIEDHEELLSTGSLSREGRAES